MKSACVFFFSSFSFESLPLHSQIERVRVLFFFESLLPVCVFHGGAALIPLSISGKMTTTTALSLLLLVALAHLTQGEVLLCNSFADFCNSASPDPICATVCLPRNVPLLWPQQSRASISLVSNPAGSSNGNNGITFNIQNTNSFPVTITEIGTASSDTGLGTVSLFFKVCFPPPPLFFCTHQHSIAL